MLEELKAIMMNESSRHRHYAEMLSVDDYLRNPFAMDKLLDSVTRHSTLPDAPHQSEA